MRLRSRVCYCLLLGAAISGLGLALEFSGLPILRETGLLLNWHLIGMIALLLPFLDWELSLPGVIALAVVLPAVEWAAISFAILSFASQVLPRREGAVCVMRAICALLKGPWLAFRGR